MNFRPMSKGMAHMAAALMESMTGETVRLVTVMNGQGSYLLERWTGTQWVSA